VDPAIIEFRGVSKSYQIYRSPGDRLRELATFHLRSHHRDFRALDDVSFEVARGETFCIVGENGSGKSTTLQLMAALLELGAGFNHEFSGRDNVYLNAAIMGFSQREIDRKFPSIEAFAEIGDFIDQPVKTYSSGMVVRLAFAVAIHLDPEILLVDEALAVGDIYFRQRCMRKVHEMRARGVTIVFVSHAIADVKAIGDRTMWLDHGRLREIGNTEHVVSKYLASIVQKDAVFLKQSRAGAPSTPSVTESHQVVRSIPNIDHRYGDARAELLGIAVLDSAGLPLAMLEPGSAIVVRISVMAHQRLELPIVGFMLRNHMGVDFAGTNTAREGFDLPAMNPGDVYTVDFHVQLPQLYPSQFSFSPAVADGTLASYVMCDWIDNAIALQMSRADQPVYGYVHLPCRVELTHG